jgi:hypothetical protein
MSSAVCVCVRVLSRRRKKEPVLLFQWRTWYAQWLWEKHTQPFCFAPEVGGSLFFLLREEKKEPKTLGTKQSGPVLKELQSDTTCVLFSLPFKTFFFTIHHHYWYQPDWPGYHFHSYWQFFEEIFKNKFFWRVCGNFFIIFFLFVVNVFIVVMPGVTCNS